MSTTPPEKLACKLTTPELARRKATVIAELKQQILQSIETDHGYAYRFPGTDIMIDRLSEFIKTERQCCEFFSFVLKIGKGDEPVWLELSGPDGSKDFIRSELAL